MDFHKNIRSLHKIKEPFETGFISNPPHTIYYEISGNPLGKPIIILHGGPGSGSNPNYRGFFDSSIYKIVQMDQRGSGKSTPFCCLESNTTWDLVQDIENLRKKLEIKKWFIVFGGSWGSTLSLAYAETHPENVSRLVIAGIFLLRKDDLDFFYQEGVNFIFPEIHEEFKNILPEIERDDILRNYYRKILFGSKDEKEKYAKMWTKYELTINRLIIVEEDIKKAETDFSLGFAATELHYFINGGFFKEKDQLLNNSYKIEHIPTIIVHGRYDMVCPVKNAYDLHKKLKNSQLWIVPDSGHSGGEPGMIDGLVRAVEFFNNNED